MESGFEKFKNASAEKLDNRDSAFTENPGFHGKIPETIGRGDDARNSLVYLTLKWTFGIGVILTIIVVVNTWIFPKEYLVPNIMKDITGVWELVIPIITLALGYAFGRSKV